MACSHESCACRITGCGLDHPTGWMPKMSATINTVVASGDDAADCVAHYLLSIGYPTDRPAHLRKMAENIVARRGLT